MKPVVSRWAYRMLVLVAIVLSAELICRLATWAVWKSRLARYPFLEQRMEETRQSVPRIDFDLIRSILKTGDASIWPALIKDHEHHGPPQVIPFGRLPETEFPKAPASDGPPEPGRVRVAFMGGSTTFLGYPQEFQLLADEEFGAGAVEVLNLGANGSNSATTLLLMRRFLPRWRPHVVVVYQGFNDLVFYGYLNAFRRLGEGKQAPDLLVNPSSYGLYRAVGKALGLDDMTPDDAESQAFLWSRVESNYRAMFELSRELDFQLVVSTFAHPDFGSLSANDRSFFETDIDYFWAVAGSVERYTRIIDSYNSHLIHLARELGIPLVDVARTIGKGGRELFMDTCHFNETGRRRHAQVVLDAVKKFLWELIMTRKSSSPGAARRTMGRLVELKPDPG